MPDLGFWAMARDDPTYTALVEPDGREVTSGELLAEANRLVHGIYDREIHLPLLLSCHAVGVQLIRNEAMKIRIQNPLLRLDLVAGGERLELLQRVPPGNDQVTQRMADDTFADDVFRLALSSDKAV